MFTHFFFFGKKNKENAKQKKKVDKKW